MSSIQYTENYVWSAHDQIGEGAMGKVYKCCSRKSGHQYAAKVFNFRAEQRPTDKKMREFEILKKSCHPNIVELVGLEICIQLHCTVLIMELCSTSMHEIIDLPENGFGLNEKDFKEVLHDMCLGMEYLHEKNIVHRDVKPGNILRTEKINGRYIYKLSDFGAARELTESDDNQFYSICGTEEYLHPDIYEKGVMDKAPLGAFSSTVDLWSFGVTLYHLATGSLPFKPVKGREDRQTMFQMINKKDVGIISVHQDPTTMALVYLSELPDNICLSIQFRSLLLPLLKGLLERNVRHAVTHQFTFKQIKKILSMQVLDVYDSSKSFTEKIYISPENTFDDLKLLLEKELCMEVTHTTKYYYKNKELEMKDGKIGNLFLKAKKEYPLIVVNKAMESAKDLMSLDHQNMSVPKMNEEKSYDGDYHISKKYCKVAFLLQREVEKLLKAGDAILQIQEIIENETLTLFARKQEHYRQIKEQYSYKQNVRLRNENISKKLQSEDERNSKEGISNGSVDSFDDLVDVFGKLEDLCNDVLVKHKLQEKWNDLTHNIECNTIWQDSVATETETINKIYDQFYRIRKNQPSNFEDVYRRGERGKMKTAFKNIIDEIFPSVLRYRNELHDALAEWIKYLDVLKENELTAKKELLETGKTFEILCEEDMSKFERNVTNINKTVDKQFDWLLENTPDLLSIVSNQNEKLNEILREMDGPI